MDGDRKYKQHGYMDSDRHSAGATRSERARPSGPKLPIDVTGPKLPRLVQSVTASRCYNCATTLPVDTDFHGNCPKCHVALHCCKQCAHFEPSTRFQCLKPVLVRIAVKDRENECQMFSARVTVARDNTPPAVIRAAEAASRTQMSAPRTAMDARAAFDSLFKK